MSQIKKKFIEIDAVDGTKLRLDNDQYIRARNAADNADVNILKVTASDEVLVTGKEWSVEQYAADWWGSLLGVWGDPFLAIGTFGGGTKDHTPDSATSGASLYTQTGSALGAAATGSTGQIFFHSGDTYGTAGSTGGIGFETGTILGATNNSSSGNFQFITGSSKGGNVGGFTFNPGTALTGGSEAVSLRTGNSSGSGTTGGILLQIGSTSGTQGDFTFRKTGVANTVGDVWTATSVNGQGYWSALPVPGADQFNKESITLIAGDITAGNVTLAQTPIANTTDLVVSGLVSTEGVDYTVTGAILDFSTHIPALIAGDIINVKYRY